MIAKLWRNLRWRPWPLIFFIVSFQTQAQRPSPASTSSVIDSGHAPNSPTQQARHYVVLVSLDGFRYDYPARYGAKHLQALAEKGASAPDGMIPSYPSITFPNHYTLVTGLYPEHHGIVGNNFYDPVRGQRYSYTDPASDTDGSWYGGTPLWVLAEQQGMRSACFFWPGSEAAIQGVRPSYYLHFDAHYPDEKRIDQVLGWLRLPPEQRPHFITLYYYEPDHSGHQFGPESSAVRDAVHHVDDLMGKLEAGLDALHLPIDLIVLADHGMEKVQGDWINLDKYADLGNFQTDGSLLYPNTGDPASDEAAAAKAYDQLKKADGRFIAYRRARVPASLDFNQNPREGDPVIVPTGPYLIRAHAPDSGEGPGRAERPLPLGMHGYDTATMKNMRAIFYAAGPDIRPGVTVKPFENVNVYPLIAHILGLETPKVDGSLNVLSGILAEAIASTP